MSGPPPKDAKLRRRRNPTQGFRVLPREGRGGRAAPSWPFSSTPEPAEQKYWDKLWSLPQAIVWEELQCEELVALYVQTFAAAQLEGGENPKLGAEVRQLDASIGVSPKSLKALHLEIETYEEEDEVPESFTSEPDPKRVYVPRPSEGEQP